MACQDYDKELMEQACDKKLIEHPCQDCGNIGELIEIPACTDWHLYNIECCSKNICKNYCQYTCKCGVLNKIVDVKGKSVDNYYDGYKCWKCEEINKIKCYYWGDVKEMCDRYCDYECGAYKNDIILDGTPFDS